MKRRWTSGLLSVAILLALLPAAVGAAPERLQDQYTDVPQSAWYATGVRQTCELGLMQGYEDGTFRPQGTLSVAQALAIACRLHSRRSDNGAELVQGSPWYQVYVDYAVANQIMAAGQLDPRNVITREQFAYLMCGAVPSESLEAINRVDALPDVRENSTYGGFVFRLYRAGVLTGGDAYGAFSPEKTIRRCDAAAILLRLTDPTLRQQFTPKPMELTGLQLAGATEVYAGDTVRWTVKPLPENVAEPWVYWLSGNPGVATVDQQGNIQTLREGETHITAAAANGVKATCLLHVKSLTRRVAAFRFAGQRLLTLSPNGSGTYSSRFTTAAGNVLKYTFSYDAAHRVICLTCGNASSLTADLTVPEDGMVFSLSASGDNGVCSAELGGQIFAPGYDGKNVDYDGTTTALQGTTNEVRRGYAEDLWELAVSSANLVLYCFESEVLKPGGYSLRDFGFTVF